MDAIAVEWGLAGLLVASFLSATILPGASEVVLVGVLAGGSAPFWGVSVATLGNTLGALTTWALGRWGSAAVLTRLLRVREQDQHRAHELFARYGMWALLLTWVPVLGDPLCAVAGILRLPMWRFVPPVLVGKLARYLMVAYIAGVVLE